MAHEEGATPELLDALIDKRHRSYMSAVHGISLGTFWARVTMSMMPIHRRWVPRYGLHLSHIFIVSVTVCSNLMFHFRDAGLLPIARLVEGDMADPTRRPLDRAPRF